VTKVVSLFLETEIWYWQESNEIPLGGSCYTSLTNLEKSVIEKFDNSEGSKSLEESTTT
jgi:hypothetical protein